MQQTDVIQRLHNHREELVHEYGVRSLALFGSVARGEANDTSDVDLLVEFDDRPIGLFHLVGTELYLAKLLGAEKVDLVLRHALIPELRTTILQEAVDVFPETQVEVQTPAHARGDRQDRDLHCR